MAEKIIRVGLVQHACSDNLEENFQKTCDGIREAAKRGAKVISTQELFRSKYFCQVQTTELFDLAETIPGPSTEKLSALAKELEVVIVASLFEKRAPGLYHNTAVIFDADGTQLGIYRKMHIPDDPLFYEKYYFTPGDTGFRVWETRYGNIGVLVCWDQWYPEAARLTALAGADILFYPTAIGWHEYEKESFGPAQLDAWTTMQRSHAIANGVFVCATNRIGWEGTVEFFGNSFICDPIGRMLAKGAVDKEEILIADLDLAVQEDVRRNWPFLRDRRIDAYQDITKRFLK